MTTFPPNRTRFARRSHSRIAICRGFDAWIVGDPPTVVLLHDLLADRSAWYPLREALSPHLRVVIPDARGHGASATLANQWYTVAELAADILAVLNAEDLSRVHVVGHGLGGATALELALRSPDRISTLMLVEPSLQHLASDSPDAVARNDLQQLRTNDRAAADAAYKQLFDRALDTYWLPRKGPVWRQSLTKQQASATRRHAPALAALLPALDAYPVDVAAIRQIACPTLIIVSNTVSRLDTVSTTRLVELLPRATLLTRSNQESVVDNTGEETVDFARQIRAFIDNTSR
jgi:pimeloyl-ACP methyl ester carboxylesterase